jgi:hypothetical protein
MSDHCSEHSRRFPVPFDQVLGPLSAPVTDAVMSDRALVPMLDLTQNRLQIIGDSFFTFAGVLNLDEVMRKLSSPGVGQD